MTPRTIRSRDWWNNCCPCNVIYSCRPGVAALISSLSPNQETARNRYANSIFLGLSG